VGFGVGAGHGFQSRVDALEDRDPVDGQAADKLDGYQPPVGGVVIEALPRADPGAVPLDHQAEGHLGGRCGSAVQAPQRQQKQNRQKTRDPAGGAVRSDGRHHGSVLLRLQ
jgi:hypothetical protein